MKSIAVILLAGSCLCAVAGESGQDRLTEPVRNGDRAEPWCPSGKDLDEYLEALQEYPWGQAAAAWLAQPPEPVITPHDGIFVIEDAGVILRRDRYIDLPMESIEYTPSGDGYQVEWIAPAYEPLSASDTPLFSGVTAWTSVPVSLGGFAFPFGGSDRIAFWITSANLIAFEEPVEPLKVGLCSKGCFFNEGHVLLDRSPRISPYQHGSVWYGQNAWIREESDRVIFTWQYNDPVNLDLQAVLFADGRIRFNYNAVSGIPWGAVTVVTGNDDFWSDLRPAGSGTDPEGDVTVPAPDGPAVDLVSASASQVGTSELLQVEFTLAGPPPPAEEERIIYRIDIRDRAGDPAPIGAVSLQYQRGSFYYMTEPAELEGSSLRLNLRLYDLPLGGNDLVLTIRTLRGDERLEEIDSLEFRAVYATPSGPLMLDLTEDLPGTTGPEPVYEAFTMPSFQDGEVLKVAGPLFEDQAAVEGFANFQNIWTDIWFFAGAYHAGGNAGADGIGRGSSAEPRSPSLLHLNNINRYNAEDEAMQVLIHELGHRWLYHFAIEEDGEASHILNPDKGHPAGWVHTPAARPVYLPLDYSVMGGSNWRDNGNGTFSSPTREEGWGSGLSWHDLYLMGLATPAEVENWWYIRDAFPPLPSAYWAPNDTHVLGTRVPVTVEQIIAVEGERYPAYPDTVQHFLAPMTLTVRPGEYTQEELDAVRNMCTVWEQRFAEATSFRGSLRCFFRPPVVDITDPPSDVNIFPGDTVNFQGTGTDGDGDAVELRWDFGRQAEAATGPGPHPVTYDTTGIYPVSLLGVDAVGMYSTETDQVTVTVDCPSVYPTEQVQNLLLRKEGGDIRFTWTDLSDPTSDYVVLMSDSLEGEFYPEADAPSGEPGLLLPMPDGNVYYEVAVRNADGCLGPY